MPAIEVISGAKEGTVIEFDTEILIGSSDDAELKIAEPGISRKHARVRRVGNGFEVVDLGAPNGTYVNFKRLEKEATSPVKDRQVVFLARTVVKFYAEGKPASGGGEVSKDDLKHMLRGTVPIAVLAEADKKLGEKARKIALNAERAEVMRRLGLHMMSRKEMKDMLAKAKN